MSIILGNPNLNVSLAVGMRRVLLSRDSFHPIELLLDNTKGLYPRTWFTLDR